VLDVDEPKAGAAEPDTPPALQLPTEVLRNVFSRLDAEALSCAAQTCIHWRAVAYEPALWRAIACARVWPTEDPDAMERMLWTPQPPRREFQTWRRLVIYRPHLRTTGIYVRRHQYAKSRSGVIIDPGDAAPVFLVTYYRLMRFFTDGTVLSLTTPEPPERSYRRLRLSAQASVAQSDLNKVYPYHGTYQLVEHNQTLTVTLPTAQDKLYPGMMNGVQHMAMSLVSTHPGAFNRLYLRDHFAVMDSGEVVSYNADYNEMAWRFVPLHGFRTKVYEHFPKEANADGMLHHWPAMTCITSS
jgi:F-box only protein C-terminal region/F-box-like